MNEGIANLKNEVQKLKVEDYLHGSRSLTRLELKDKGQAARDMPIRVLDSLIENEELGNNGFSLYNRGQDLKQSLIDPKRVKAFIDQQEREKAQQRLLGGVNRDPEKRAKRDKATDRL